MDCNSTIGPKLAVLMFFVHYQHFLIHFFIDIDILLVKNQKQLLRFW